MIRGKIWGETSEIFSLNSISCMSLSIKKGTSCSWHKHINKNNGFYVFKGELLIQVIKNNYKLTDSTLLLPRESTYVVKGEQHRFIGITDVIAIEWYWSELESDDIERIEVGKMIVNKEMLNIYKIVHDLRRLKGV